MNKLVTTCLFALFFQKYFTQTLTEPAYIVPKKEFQVEMYYNFINTKLNNNSYESTHLIASLVRYGILDNFEILASIPYQFSINKDDKTNGFNVLSAGIKTKIISEKKLIPEISILATIGFSELAHTDFKTKNNLFGFTLAFYNTLNENANLNYNISTQWDGENANPNYGTTIIYTHALSDKFSFFTEFFYNYYYDHTSDYSLDFGTNTMLNSSIQWDLIAGFGLKNFISDYFFSTGFTIFIKNQKK